MSEHRRWSSHPLVQLTQVRYREFFREPEAVFWVFIFPVLLAAGLGLAFRNRAPDRTTVAVVGSKAGTLVTALRQQGQIDASAMDDSAAALALRNGDVAVVVSANGQDRLEYRYDDTPPESRIARLPIDSALQTSEG